MSLFTQQVFDFNSDVLKTSQPEQICNLSLERASHKFNSLLEEASEFHQAVIDGDRVGAVDAIIDSMYFGIGILFEMGLSVQQIDNIQSAVHAANMTKRRGTVTRGNTTSDGDAVKPDGWVPPEQMIKEILGL